MRSLYIIKVGTTFPHVAQQFGDFEDWTRKGVALSRVPIVVVDALAGEALPLPGQCAGVLLTGSHEMVTERLPWSLVVERWIPSIVQAGVPFLGICYGHQLLAQAMGGEAGFHPGGPEAGTKEVLSLPEIDGDLLFDDMPPSFDAHTVHEQTVLQLPPGAVRLACNAFEPNHAFRLGQCAWGVQFHPEYDEQIMRAYLHTEADQLGNKRMDVHDLLDNVRETPHAAWLLANFGALVDKRWS